MARKLRLAQEILNIIYPVGSIYLSTDTINPNSKFGGTWVQIKDGFLYCSTATSGSTGNQGNLTGYADTKAASGNTGSTTLTTSHLPKDMGKFRPLMWNGDNPSGIIAKTGVGTYDRTAGNGNGFGGIELKLDGGGQGHTHTLNNHAHSIPYTAVTVWKRTA